MKTVITGAAGLLGWHLQCHLSVLDGWKDTVIALDRKAFNDDAVLDAALDGADVVVHCAGINRAEDAELEQGNIDLANRLVDSFTRVNAKPHLLYSNTIHKERDNAYGRGKAGAGRVFQGWAETENAHYSDLVLPHVFGEGGRPFYNSAVFTFCKQIVDSEPLSINAGGMLELLHAQDICARIVDAVERGQSGEIRLKGQVISAAEVAGKLSAMHASYTGHVVYGQPRLIV